MIKVSNNPYYVFSQRCAENRVTINWAIEANRENYDACNKLLEIIDAKNLSSSFWLRRNVMLEYEIDVLVKELESNCDIQYRKLAGNLDMDNIDRLREKTENDIFLLLDYESGGLDSFMV